MLIIFNFRIFEFRNLGKVDARQFFENDREWREIQTAKTSNYLQFQTIRQTVKSLIKTDSSFLPEDTLRLEYDGNGPLLVDEHPFHALVEGRLDLSVGEVEVEWPVGRLVLVVLLLEQRHQEDAQLVGRDVHRHGYGREGTVAWKYTWVSKSSPEF